MNSKTREVIGNIYETKDEQPVSNCCGAPVDTDLMICSDCKEHLGDEDIEGQNEND